MRDRPSIFSAPMVKAILAGTKTMTRRIVKPAPPSVEDVRRLSGADFSIFTDAAADSPAHFRVAGPVWAVRELMGREADYEWTCPYGAPGGRLWVRETWQAYDPDGAVARHPMAEDSDLIYRAEVAPDEAARLTWRPSIYMPRWASRITLEVTGTRVERLHDLTESDARAEGVVPAPFCKACRPSGLEHVEAFEGLWESIHGVGAWAENPWVWVVSFWRVAP